MTNSHDTFRRHAPAEDSLSAQLGRDTSVPQVYDFASSADEPPQPKMVSLPRWPGYVGHTRHQGDVIWLENRPYFPDEPVDLRCSGCKADSTVAFDEPGRFLVFIVGHQAGCQAVEDLITMAEAAS